MIELRLEYMEGGIEVNETLLRMEESEFRDEMEVLEAVLEESLYYDSYKRVAGMIGDADTRALLHELAGEEWSHINSLLSEIIGRVEEKPRWFLNVLNQKA